MVNIEINGQAIEAQEGAMVIEAAEKAGVTIPRFCYHSKLSLAASCRMCLVEVENQWKPAPACATPVADGMKVFTRSPKAIASQRAVMEFLLINHPLDCPICDQGGECDLQEVAVGYGQDTSHYSETKRIVKDKDIGPVISTDLTRCIQCTRCVRFGTEIAGLMELGAPGRGEHMHIGTFVEHGVTSELAGNLADVCPVGSLTQKPYRYKGRPWEMDNHSTISLQDSVGSNMRVDTRRGEIMRVVPETNEAVNECWLADRDRFAYQAVHHEDRITRPRIKTNGRWHEVDWDRALTFAASGLKNIAEANGGDKLGALSGTVATTEELYLLQKMMRGIGSNNIDHRLGQVDFSGQDNAPAYPSLGQAIADIENVNAALVVGSNTRLDQPLIATRLRKAARNGASVTFVNPVDLDQRIADSNSIVAAPQQMAANLAAIAQAAAQMSGRAAPDTHKALIDGAEVTDTHQAIAQSLIDGESSTVLVGNFVTYSAQKNLLTQLAAVIAELTGSKLGYLADGGNSVGAAMAGALPHRGVAGTAVENPGKDWLSMVNGGLSGYVVMAMEPEKDSVAPQQTVDALSDADFTVVLGSFDSPTVNEYADVVLPVGTYFETAGSAVNIEGTSQSFKGVVAPVGDARPAWKVLRVLGNLLDVVGFEYMSVDEVTAEVQAACEGVTTDNNMNYSAVSADTSTNGLSRIVSYPAYGTDAMVRRSETLQQTTEGQLSEVVRISRKTAEKSGVAGAEQVIVKQDETSATMTMLIDDGIPEDCIYLPAATAAVVGFGADANGFELASV